MRPRTLLAALFTLATLCLVPAAAPAQDARAREEAEAVARAFFQAVAAERWAEAARFLDVAPIERRRRQIVEAAREPQHPPHELTAEELMRRDPDMPRAVAEYQVKKWREAATQARVGVEHEFAGVSDADALARLSPEQAAARWLEAQDHRGQQRRQYTALGCAPAFDSLPPEPPNVVIGAVVRDSNAYVLHQRAEFAAPPGDEEFIGPQVLHLRRRAGRWVIPARWDVLRIPNVVMGISECRGPDGAPRRRPPA